MKKLFRLLICIAMVVSFAGTAGAYNLYEHVKIAPNGKGDSIIYPFYFAAPGLQTKFAVYNPSDYLVAAKVVIRTHNLSEEVLDFMLYLSPHDYFSGYIKDDGAGPYLFSEDDSLFRAPGVWSSSTNPVAQPLFPVNCPTIDSSNFGYIEVFEQCAIKIQGKTATGQPYAAAYARALNKLNVTSTNTSPSAPINKWLVYYALEDARLAPQAENLETAYNRAGWTENVMSGALHIQSPAAGWSASMRPTILQDYHVDRPLTVGADTSFRFRNARNILGELEAALAKNNLSLPYVNKPGTATLHVLTFPTKMSVVGGDLSAATKDVLLGFNKTYGACDYVNGYFDQTRIVATTLKDIKVDIDAAKAGTTAGVVPQYSPYFYYENWSTGNMKCLTYTPAPYNMTENTTARAADPIWSGGTSVDTTVKICEEMSLVPTGGFGSVFDEGYITYQFQKTGKSFGANVGTNRSNLIKFYVDEANDTGGTQVPSDFVMDGDDDVTGSDADDEMYYYEGAPVIGAVFTLDAGISLYDGAHDDGRVWTDNLGSNADAAGGPTVVDKLYHYFDQRKTEAGAGK